MIALSDFDTAGVTLIADKGYRRASFEAELNNAGITLIRPHRRYLAQRNDPTPRPRPITNRLRPLTPWN
jgi:hypothetical protein